jgi:hypothetical protein
MVGVRDRMGLLCDQLSRWPDLDGIIRDAGAGAELEALLAVLGGEGESDEDRVAGWVEAIEDACTQKGARAGRQPVGCQKFAVPVRCPDALRSASRT